MPAQISPRRVITVDDSGTLTQAPTPPRRAPVPPPRPVVAPRPSPQRVIPIDDEGRTVYVPNYAARGNAVAVTTSLVAATSPRSNIGVARSRNQMAGFESETYQDFLDAGADDRHLFAGQRGVWEDDDSRYGTQRQGGRSNPDRQNLRSGQRAVWEGSEQTNQTGYYYRGPKRAGNPNQDCIFGLYVVETFGTQAVFC